LYVGRSLVAELKHVYIYRIGAGNCYKIGRTKHPPGRRMRGWATGSPVKPKLYRDVLTDNPSGLETYIHHLLEVKRTENGEFFAVTQDELDQAVDRAEAFANEFHPLSREAKRLSRKKPSDRILEATDDIRDLYQSLRKASWEKYLLDREIGKCCNNGLARMPVPLTTIARIIERPTALQITMLARAGCSG
jgi:hypothetical protein